MGNTFVRLQAGFAIWEERGNHKFVSSCIGYKLFETHTYFVSATNNGAM